MKPNIVILDEVELSDAQQDRLRSLGAVTSYQTNPADEEEVLVRAVDAEILLLGWTGLNAALLARLTRLRMISVWATGYDYVDTQAARRQGVTTCNIPAYAGTAVAELTIGLMLGLARQLVPADRHVRGGDYSWRGFRGSELSGKTLGLVGLGDIGGAVAGIARALGMTVLAHVRNPTPERAAQLGCEFVPLDVVLRRSDVLSLHLPLTSQTRGLIGAAQLAAMKPSAHLINTARAQLVDQAALVAALTEGTIAGAALDDITLPATELAALPNVILTPHIGFFTEEALLRKGDVCVDNVAAYLAGSPVNVVG